MATGSGRSGAVKNAVGTAAVLAMLATGCAENAPLEVLDRPLVSYNGESVYLVHLGDDPVLRFAPQWSAPDYLIVRNDTTSQYEEGGVQVAGAFEWRRRFSQTTPEGQFVTLTALGYRQNDGRDFMAIAGELEENDPTIDRPDELVASGTVRIRVYQSRITFEVPPREEPIEWTLSWLDLKTSKGRRARVRYTTQPRRGAFTATPQANGGWLVEYEPELHQIDLGGETIVELNLADRYGRPKTLTDTWRPQ